MAEGSRWIVVDDLLYETPEYHRTRRRSCRTMVLRPPIDAAQPGVTRSDHRRQLDVVKPVR